MIRDYFADLELTPAASLEDVRRSFKKLARRFHPDLNPKDEYALESFRVIQEAYEALQTPERLQAYRERLEALSAWSEDSGLWDRRPRLVMAQEEKTWPGGAPSTNRRKENLDIHIMLSVDQASLSRGRKSIQLPVEEICSQCEGAGGDSSAVKRTCKSCAGMGFQLIRRGAFRWKRHCETCLGKGYEVLRACPSCLGYGKIRREAVLELEIPRQIDPSRASIYKEKGHAGRDGKTRGDLWVNWRI